MDYEATQPMPERSPTRPQPSPRRPRRLPRPRRRRTHHLDLPHVRSDRVRSAARRALRRVAWAGGGADFQHSTRRQEFPKM